MAGERQLSFASSYQAQSEKKGTDIDARIDDTLRAFVDTGDSVFDNETVDGKSRWNIVQQVRYNILQRMRQENEASARSADAMSRKHQERSNELSLEAGEYAELASQYAAAKKKYDDSTAAEMDAVRRRAGRLSRLFLSAKTGKWREKTEELEASVSEHGTFIHFWADVFNRAEREYQRDTFRRHYKNYDDLAKTWYELTREFARRENPPVAQATPAPAMLLQSSSIVASASMPTAISRAALPAAPTSVSHTTASPSALSLQRSSLTAPAVASPSISPATSRTNIPASTRVPAPAPVPAVIDLKDSSVATALAGILATKSDAWKKAMLPGYTEAIADMEMIYGKDRDPFHEAENRLVNHYVTITGLDISTGMLQIYDSQGYNGAPAPVKLEEFVRGTETIQINWLSDTVVPGTEEFKREFPDYSVDEAKGYGYSGIAGDEESAVKTAKTAFNESVTHTRGVTYVRALEDGVSLAVYVPREGMKVDTTSLGKEKNAPEGPPPAESSEPPSAIDTFPIQTGLLSGMNESFESQKELNCFVVTGTAMLNQYISSRGGKDRVVRFANQDEMREYIPLARKNPNKEAGYKDQIEGVKRYAGKGKEGRVGSIFEMGDFLMERLAGHQMGNAVLYKEELPIGETPDQQAVMQARFTERIQSILKSNVVAGVMTSRKAGPRPGDPFAGIEQKDIRYYFTYLNDQQIPLPSSTEYEVLSGRTISLYEKLSEAMAAEAALLASLPAPGITASESEPAPLPEGIATASTGSAPTPATGDVTGSAPSSGGGIPPFDVLVDLWATNERVPDEDKNRLMEELLDIRIQGHFLRTWEEEITNQILSYEDSLPGYNGSFRGWMMSEGRGDLFGVRSLQARLALLSFYLEWPGPATLESARAAAKTASLEDPEMEGFYRFRESPDEILRIRDLADKGMYMAERKEELKHRIGRAANVFQITPYDMFQSLRSDALIEFEPPEAPAPTAAPTSAVTTVSGTSAAPESTVPSASGPSVPPASGAPAVSGAAPEPAPVFGPANSQSRVDRSLSRLIEGTDLPPISYDELRENKRIIPDFAAKRIEEYIGEYDLERVEVLLESLIADPGQNITPRDFVIRDNKITGQDSRNIVDPARHRKIHTGILMLSMADPESGMQRRFKLGQDFRGRAAKHQFLGPDFRGRAAGHQFLGPDTDVMRLAQFSPEEQREMAAEEMNLEADERDAGGRLLYSENNAAILSARLKRNGQTVHGFYLNGEYITDEVAAPGEDVSGKGDTSWFRGPDWEKQEKAENLRAAIRKSIFFQHVNARTIQFYTSYNAQEDYGNAIGVALGERITKAAGGQNPQTVTEAVGLLLGANPNMGQIRSELIGPAIAGYIIQKMKPQSGRNAQQQRAGTFPADNPKSDPIVASAIENHPREVTFSCLMLLMEEEPRLWTVARALTMANTMETSSHTLDKLTYVPRSGEMMRMTLMDELANHTKIGSDFSLEDMRESLAIPGIRVYQEELNSRRGKVNALKRGVVSGEIFRQVIRAGQVGVEAAENISDIGLKSGEQGWGSEAERTERRFWFNYAEGVAQATNGLSAFSLAFTAFGGLAGGTEGAAVSRDLFFDVSGLFEGVGNIVKMGKEIGNCIKRVRKWHQLRKPENADEKRGTLEDLDYGWLKSILGALDSFAAALNNVRDIASIHITPEDSALSTLQNKKAADVLASRGIIDLILVNFRRLIKIGDFVREIVAAVKRKGRIDTANEEIDTAIGNLERLTPEQFTELTARMEARQAFGPSAITEATPEETERRRQEDLPLELAMAATQNSQAQLLLGMTRWHANEEIAEGSFGIVTNVLAGLDDAARIFGGPLLRVFTVLLPRISEFIGWITKTGMERHALTQAIEMSLGSEYAAFRYPYFDEVLDRETGIKSKNYLTDLARIFMAIDTHAMIMNPKASPGDLELGKKVVGTMYGNVNDESVKTVKLTDLMRYAGLDEKTNWRDLLRNSLMK